MPVDSPRVKPKVSKNNGDISDQLPKSDIERRLEQAEQAEVNQAEVNQAEVKQAVNEAQQIADTLKQSKQTVKTDNSYGEEVKTVKFKPMVLYIQNHIPKATNYESGEVKTVKFKPVVYIQNHIPKATNYESGEFTTGGYIVWAVCVILGFMLFVMFDKFVQWIKRKLKQCFKRS